MGDLVAFPKGRPIWLGIQRSKMTPAQRQDSEAFDRYLLAMHKQGWRYAELASRHLMANRTVWTRVQRARELRRTAAVALETRQVNERVLRTRVAAQEAQLAAQAGRISELAERSRRAQQAERQVATLRQENRELQAKIETLLSASRVELKIAS